MQHGPCRIELLANQRKWKASIQGNTLSKLGHRVVVKRQLTWVFRTPNKLFPAKQHVLFRALTARNLVRQLVDIGFVYQTKLRSADQQIIKSVAGGHLQTLQMLLWNEGVACGTRAPSAKPVPQLLYFSFIQL